MRSTKTCSIRRLGAAAKLPLHCEVVRFCWPTAALPILDLLDAPPQAAGLALAYPDQKGLLGLSSWSGQGRLKVKAIPLARGPDAVLA